MSLHLGSDFVISSKQIVAVLNLQKLDSPYSLAKALFCPKTQDRIRKIGEGPYRSAILCHKGTIYYSPLDSNTLANRMRRESVWLKINGGKYHVQSNKEGSQKTQDQH